MPMEAESGPSTGDTELTLDLSPNELAAKLKSGLASVPFVRGINNHMGSLLTQVDEPMHWLMHTLREAGDLYFIDSRTSAHSIAARVAYEVGVPNFSRDVFLDNERNTAEIFAQFERLVARARSRGSALAIGHPFPETLEVLEWVLPQLAAYGVELVPLSRLIRDDSPPYRRTPPPVPTTLTADADAATDECCATGSHSHESAGESSASTRHVLTLSTRLTVEPRVVKAATMTTPRGPWSSY